MAVDDESIGYGITISVNDGPGGAYQAIPKCELVGVPSKVVGTVESKRVDLVNRVIKKLKTLTNGGSFQFRCQHTNATYDRLKTIRDDYTSPEAEWEIVVPDDNGDTTFEVPGILTEAKVEDVEAEKITVIMCTVEVSGDDL